MVPESFTGFLTGDPGTARLAAGKARNRGRRRRAVAGGITRILCHIRLMALMEECRRTSNDALTRGLLGKASLEVAGFEPARPRKVFRRSGD